jgi:ribosomal protein S18 acetylase RimI-like enzyme
MERDYDIRAVSAAETRTLRQEVLRPHQRLDEVGFAGDGLPGAAHFGAFVGGEMVATATVHPDEGTWRLRGMATRDGFRGRGLGGALVQACVEHARASGGKEMWCNARLKAADFYRRHGFEVRGEVFELPEIGPHLYMRRAL